MKNLLIRTAGLFIVTMMIGCLMAGSHNKSINSGNEKERTLGEAQRNINIGMSQADVAEALGSPNIVTNDDEGTETWIYDSIATEASYSQSSGGLFLVLGAVGGSSGASSTTQKTLTVVIRFDKDRKVSSCKYHSSKF